MTKPKAYITRRIPQAALDIVAAACDYTIWDSEEQYQAGMAKIQAARAKNPQRHRPAPTSVTRYTIYGEAHSPTA